MQFDNDVRAAISGNKQWLQQIVLRTFNIHDNQAFALAWDHLQECADVTMPAYCDSIIHPIEMGQLFDCVSPLFSTFKCGNNCLGPFYCTPDRIVSFCGANVDNGRKCHPLQIMQQRNEFALVCSEPFWVQLTTYTLADI